MGLGKRGGAEGLVSLCSPGVVQENRKAGETENEDQDRRKLSNSDFFKQKIRFLGLLSGFQEVQTGGTPDGKKLCQNPKKARNG